MRHERIQHSGRAMVAIALLAASALPSASQADASAAQILVASTILFWLLGFVLTVVEGRFFSTAPPPVGWVHFLGALAFALAAAAVTAVVAGRPQSASWSEHWQRFLGDRSIATAALQLVAAGATFVGVHGVVGSLVWPLVRRYYENPSLGLALRVPPPQQLLPFQAGWGVIGVVALLPWLLLVRVDDMRGWLGLALTMTVTMGIVPLLSATSWPVALRWLHTAEIAVIATIWSFVLWRVALR